MEPVMTKRLAAVGSTVWRQAGDGVLAALLFAASLALYVRTLAPSVAALFDDSLEFPLVVQRLAIAHPTGYPLYILLGKLFTLGTKSAAGAGDVALASQVAYRVNLLSAVTGAVTVVLVYLVGRQVARRRLPALVGALALAVSPVFWSQAIVAEVYTLHSAFVAAALLVALLWARRPWAPVSPASRLQPWPPAREEDAGLPDQTGKPQVQADGEEPSAPGGRAAFSARVSQRGKRALALYRRVFPPVPAKSRLQLHPLTYVLVGLLGLSLTHHRTMLLLVPALFLFALAVDRRIFSRAALLGPAYPDRPRWLQVIGRPIFVLLACFFVPQLLYLYLPLRGHVSSLDGVYQQDWASFWGWVNASLYSAFLVDNPLARDLSAAEYARLFWQQFGPVGLALALVGLAGLVRKPRVLVLTGLSFLTFIAFAVLYRVPDVEVFLIPAFLLVAVWIAAGLDWALHLLRTRGPSLAWRRLLAICSLLLALAAVIQPLSIAATNYHDLDLSRRWIVHDYGQYLISEPLPRDSIIVGLQGEMNLLRYFQEAAGLRPDIDTILADREPDRWAALEAAQATGRPVYVTRDLPGLADAYALSAVTGIVDVLGSQEALIHVGQPEYEMPDLPRSADEEPVPGLRLLGYGLRHRQGHWQAWTRLRLWWQAPEGLSPRHKISARLVDAEGQVLAATDAEPVAGTYPTTVWRPGEVVADAYEIPLPAGTPPGEYTPLVIVYDPETGAERGRALLAPFYLAGNPARPPRRALEASVAQVKGACLGDVELVGYTPPSSDATFRAGDSLPLTLLWQAHGQPAGDLTAAFWLEGASQASVAESPVGGLYPASQWQEDQLVRQGLQLPAPVVETGGIYRLRMRVLSEGQPLPWGNCLIPLGSDLDLGAVELAP
jgi:hypothetical protein